MARNGLCQNCQRPLQLFVQLALATLPAELQGELGSAPHPGLFGWACC